jgi:hypothetical protein
MAPVSQLLSHLPRQPFDDDLRQRRGCKKPPNVRYTLLDLTFISRLEFPRFLTIWKSEVIPRHASFSITPYLTHGGPRLIPSSTSLLNPRETWRPEENLVGGYVAVIQRLHPTPQAGVKLEERGEPCKCSREVHLNVAPRSSSWHER